MKAIVLSGVNKGKRGKVTEIIEGFGYIVAIDNKELFYTPREVAIEEEDNDVQHSRK